MGMHCARAEGKAQIIGQGPSLSGECDLFLHFPKYEPRNECRHIPGTVLGAGQSVVNEPKSLAVGSLQQGF